jgi:hypothetical protein
MDTRINKKQILQAIEELPEDATIEQAMYKLHVLEEIYKAVSDPERYSQDEVEAYFLERRKKRVNSSDSDV